jgi:hypothetical protein
MLLPHSSCKAVNTHALSSSSSGTRVWRAAPREGVLPTCQSVQRPGRVAAGCIPTTAGAAAAPVTWSNSSCKPRQRTRQSITCAALDTQSNGAAAGAVEQPPLSANGSSNNSSSSNGENGSSSGSSGSSAASFVSSSGSYDSSDTATISTLIAESEATASASEDSSGGNSSSSPGTAVLACEDAALSPSDSADDLCAVDEIDTPESLTDLNYSGRGGPAPDMRRVNFTLGTWAEDEDPFSSWWKNRCEPWCEL